MRLWNSGPIEWCFCDILDILFIRQENSRWRLPMAQWWPLGWSSTPVSILWWQLQSTYSKVERVVAGTPSLNFTASIQDAQLLLLFTPYHISGNSPRCPHLSPARALKHQWTIEISALSFGQLMLLSCFLPGWFFFFFAMPGEIQTEYNYSFCSSHWFFCCLTFLLVGGIWKSNSHQH